MFTWSSGSLGGTGAINIPSTADFNIGGSTVNFHSRTVNNSGTTSFSGGGNIHTGNGAVFNNLSGGVFNHQTNTSFAYNLGGTAPVFNNMPGAIFRRTGPAGVATMNVRLQNNGLVDVDTTRHCYL